MLSKSDGNLSRHYKNHKVRYNYLYISFINPEVTQIVEETIQIIELKYLKLI